jgi:uncharacterized membrane protein YphA (DoxX/SURF4 family)
MPLPGNMEVMTDYYLLVSYLAVYARWILGIVLMVAGVAKGRDLDGFDATIQAFRLIPRQSSNIAAHFIVILELILGVCLLVGVGTRFAIIVAAGLFGSFMLAIVVNLIRHNILDCHCFGPYFRQKISLRAVGRNLVFILLCLWAWRFYDGYLTLEGWLLDGATRPDHSLPLFLLLTGMMLFSGLTALSLKIVSENFKLAKSD